jgi:6-phosphogluconolactonase
MSAPNFVVCADAAALAVRAADLFIQSAADAIRERQRFTVALSGGSTPEKMYALLAAPERVGRVDWSRTFLFFGDERFAPDGDPRANLTMVRRSLLAGAPVPPANFFPVPTDLPSPAASAAAYAATLGRFFGLDPKGPPPVFDLVFLGLGDDGHTASLFPGRPAVGVTDVWVTDSPPGVLPPPVDRVTFTFPTINAARHVVFLVGGANKAGPLREILKDGPSVNDKPAVGVRPTTGTLTWMLDEAAAAGLSLGS